MKDPRPLIEKAVKAFEAGKYPEAEKFARRALKLAPTDDGLHNLVGIACLNQGSPRKAVAHLEKAVQIAPANPLALNNLGVARAAVGDPEGALEAMRRARDLDPNSPSIRVDLGQALIHAGLPADALAEADAALAVNPGHPPAMLLKGQALRELGDLAASKRILDTAAADAPDFAQAHAERAYTLRDIGDFEDALGAIDKAIALAPGKANYHRYRGMILRFLGRFEDAAEAAGTAHGIEPGNAEITLSLAIALLTLGRLSEAWKIYDARWSTFPKDKVHPLSGRTWNGKRLLGAGLLVRSEQGPGDELVFASCLPDLIAATEGERVAVECDPRLVPALSRTYPELAFLPRATPAKGEPPHKGYDLECGFGSLPALYRPNVAAIEAAQPRALIADPALTGAWRERLAALGDGLKVGIAWRGGATAAARFSRSSALSEFLPILRIAGCRFINLQYGDVADEIAALADEHGVVVHDYPEVDPLKELEQQIAQIAALDLVIQTSNTSAHIAGALGRPTWVLQSFSPYWPWFLDRNDMPWYADVRQFRMRAPDDRARVVRDIADALAERVQNPSGASST